MGDANYKKRHRELGLCRDCSQPAVAGKIFCLKHSLRNAERNKRYRESHYEQEIQRLRRLKKRYYVQGRCPQCGAPMGDGNIGYNRCMNCTNRLYIIPCR